MPKWDRIWLMFSADPWTTETRESFNSALRKSTNSGFNSMSMSRASEPSRGRISLLMVPTPGPYSMITLADPKSISAMRCLIRKGELGTNEPNILGCLTKLRANNQAWLATIGALLVTTFQMGGATANHTILN